MRQWLVGTDNGMLLVNGIEFTTEIGKATRFEKIGDAMRECIRLNNLELGLTSKFKVIPLEFSSYEDYVNYLKEKGLAIEAPI